MRSSSFTSCGRSVAYSWTSSPVSSPARPARVAAICRMRSQTTSSSTMEPPYGVMDHAGRPCHPGLVATAPTGAPNSAMNALARIIGNIHETYSGPVSLPVWTTRGSSPERRIMLPHKRVDLAFRRIQATVDTDVQFVEIRENGPFGGCDTSRLPVYLKTPPRPAEPPVSSLPRTRPRRHHAPP